MSFISGFVSLRDHCFERSSSKAAFTKGGKKLQLSVSSSSQEATLEEKKDNQITIKVKVDPVEIDSK